MLYTNLHCHSDFSNASCGFADSINRIEQIVERAKELGMEAVALTDHECLSGTVKFIKACGKADIKPIIGNEIYLLHDETYDEIVENNFKFDTDYYHLILIALDTEGYRQLCQLSSIAWNRVYKRRVLRRPTLYSDLKEIVGKNQGHVLCSTACLGGELAKTCDPNVLFNLKDIFGEGNVFAEIQPNDKYSEQWESNERVISLAKKNGFPVIATTDAHMLNGTEFEKTAHKAFKNSRADESGEESEDIYKTAYLMGEDELRGYLKNQTLSDEDIEQIFKTTMEISDRVAQYDIFANPDIPTIPEQHIPEFEVRHIFKEYYEEYPILKHYAYHENKQVRLFYFKIENGFEEKVLNSDREFKLYFDRLIEELEEEKRISDTLGTEMTCYYSTAQEIVNLMWECGSLVGASRGSAGDAFIAYLLDIVQMCPVELGIEYSFWRHASVERGAEVAD